MPLSPSGHNKRAGLREQDRLGKYLQMRDLIQGNIVASGVQGGIGENEVSEAAEGAVRAETGQSHRSRRSWTMDEFDAQTFPPADHLIRPWLPMKGLAMIAGWRGVGKTFAAAGVAMTVASGVPFLGWEVPEPRRVLYVDGEMDPAEMRDKRLKRMRAALSPEARGRLRQNLYFLSHHVFPDTGIPDLSDPEKAGRRLIEEEAEAIGAQLIILDNLSCLCTSGIENDAESWQSMQDWLLKLRRAGYTVLLLHHGGKPDRSGRSRQRGTSKREDVLNTSIMLQPGEDKSTFEWEFTKNRGFHPEDTFMVSIGDDGWVRRAETADRDAQILALAAQGLTQRDIAGRVGCSPGLVNKVLQKQRAADAATATTVH
jgi:putative DNA primase/helicase